MKDDEKITIKWGALEDTQEELTQFEAIKKLYETYQQFLEAGFSKAEALTIITGIIRGGKNGS